MSTKRTSSLLIDEQPLQVIPTLAEAIGVNAAILLQQINYWIKLSEKKGESEKFKADKWWTYNTYSDWQEQMPWLTESGIRKLVNKLKDDGLIAVVKHAKQGRDHTLWYTINYEAVEKLRTKGQIEVPLKDESKCPTGSDDDVPLRDTSYATESPENLSENSLRGAEAPEKPAKALTTLTVDRTREVGFQPSPGQVANWGRGWSKFVYVGENETPPDAERQFAVLSEIVAAAAGRLGKTRFFLSVQDALKRLENKANQNPVKRDRAESKPERAAKRTEGYEEIFDKPASGTVEELRRRLEAS